jgi:hypothetical protein
MGSERSMSDNATGNPLANLLNGTLSEYDFGVLEHGFVARKATLGGTRKIGVVDFQSTFA